eukprot:5723262-Heterocapsa_arctica.AAC.1
MVHVPAGLMLQPIGEPGRPNVKTEGKRRNSIRRWDAWLESGRRLARPNGRDPRLSEHEVHPGPGEVPEPYFPGDRFPNFATRCRPAACSAD